jgi:Cys-tRNA(Pro)/Cys-tRNA(Cys) deacylase
MGFATIFVSAGKRGVQLEVSPTDLVHLTDAAVARIATA